MLALKLTIIAVVIAIVYGFIPSSSLNSQKYRCLKVNSDSGKR